MKALALLLFLPFLTFAQDVPKKEQLKAKRITSNAIALFNEGQSSNAYMLLKQAVAIDPNNEMHFIGWLTPNLICALIFMPKNTCKKP